MNEFTLKDSFDAVNKIKNILPHLFDDGYYYVFFDVESLFTNVPIKRPTDIIPKRIYIDKAISTNLKKRSLKMLLLDTCTKTAFKFNGAMYEQRDSVCMRCSLGSMLANVIMIDFEEKVIKTLINDNRIRFNARFVNDTLFVIKREGVSRIQNPLNNFEPNLRFTVDLFQNEVPHFLDLELSPDGISICRKNTNTGLYTHFRSYVPWIHRTAWIKSLTWFASRICSPDKLFFEINFIRKSASWNGFPRPVVKSIIHEVLNTTDAITNNTESPEVLTINALL